MPPELIIGALATTLSAVALAFYKFLLDRLKRSEDREEARDKLFERLADALEDALGIKVER